MEYNVPLDSDLKTYTNGPDKIHHNSMEYIILVHKLQTRAPQATSGAADGPSRASAQAPTSATATSLSSCSARMPAEQSLRHIVVLIIYFYTWASSIPRLLNRRQKREE